MDERGDATTFPVFPLVVDYFENAQLLGVIEERHQPQMSLEEIRHPTESGVAGVLGFAERRPRPALQPGGHLSSVDRHGRGVAAQSEVGRFGSLAGVDGEGDDVERLNLTCDRVFALGFQDESDCLNLEPRVRIVMLAAVEATALAIEVDDLADADEGQGEGFPPQGLEDLTDFRHGAGAGVESVMEVKPILGSFEAAIITPRDGNQEATLVTENSWLLADASNGEVFCMTTDRQKRGKLGGKYAI